MEHIIKGVAPAQEMRREPKRTRKELPEQSPEPNVNNWKAESGALSAAIAEGRLDVAQLTLEDISMESKAPDGRAQVDMEQTERIAIALMQNKATDWNELQPSVARYIEQALEEMAQESEWKDNEDLERALEEMENVAGTKRHKEMIKEKEEFLKIKTREQAQTLAEETFKGKSIVEIYQDAPQEFDAIMARGAREGRVELRGITFERYIKDKQALYDAQKELAAEQEKTNFFTRLFNSRLKLLKIEVAKVSRDVQKIEDYLAEQMPTAASAERQKEEMRSRYSRLEEQSKKTGT